MNWQPLKPAGKWLEIPGGDVHVFRRDEGWWQFFAHQNNRVETQDHQTEAAAMQAAEAWVKGEKRAQS